MLYSLAHEGTKSQSDRSLSARHRRAGGQYITVFPLYDIIVTHKVNIDQDESRAVPGPTYMTILDMVLDAKCGATDKNCR